MKKKIANLICCFIFVFVAVFSLGKAENSVIKVSSFSQLAALRDADVSGKKVVLTGDIKVVGEYTPFSLSNVTIDGSGYSIKGTFVPLFNELTDSQVVNLGIDGDVSGEGMLAKRITNTSIDSCYFNGTVTGTSSGFIAGVNSGGSASNIAVSGSIKTDASAIFFGNNAGGVRDSWFAGTIDGQIRGISGAINCYYDKDIR